MYGGGLLGEKVMEASSWKLDGGLTAENTHFCLFSSQSLWV